MNVTFGSKLPILCFNSEWAKSALAESGNFVGKSLRNPLAIGTVLRLLRFLDNDLKDQWLSDLLTLTKSNRKCVSMLASLPEWQPCLFSLISETLELVSSRRPNTSGQSNGVENAPGAEGDENGSASVLKRLDLCLHLHSTLLGHLFRSGGERVSHIISVYIVKPSFRQRKLTYSFVVVPGGSRKGCRASTCVCQWPSCADLNSQQLMRKYL